MEENSPKRKAIEELKGEIELKESTVKAAQEMFARQLNNGMGQEIRDVLSKNIENKKVSFWQRIKENFRKLNN